MRTAKVNKFPQCDFCEKEGIRQEAKYDGRTFLGPWGYMCERHFKRFGVGLGTGRGQKLIIKKD
jgi:hypothetical protein